MKRIVISLIAALAAAFLAPDGNAIGFGGVQVNNWAVESVMPTSFSSVNATVRMNITSTRPKTVIREISGIIYSKSGEMFVIGTVDDMVIHRGTADLRILGHGSLPSYMVLLSILKNFSFNPADYTADIRATVKTGLGRAHQVELKGVSLGQFIH